MYLFFWKLQISRKDAEETAGSCNENYFRAVDAFICCKWNHHEAITVHRRRCHALNEKDKRWKINDKREIAERTRNFLIGLEYLSLLLSVVLFPRFLLWFFFLFFSFKNWVSAYFILNTKRERERERDVIKKKKSRFSIKDTYLL